MAAVDVSHAAVCGVAPRQIGCTRGVPRMRTLACAVACALAGGAALAQPQSPARQAGDEARGTGAPALPVLRPDERRTPRPLTLDLGGRSLQLGGSYEASIEGRFDFDLDGTRQRHRDVQEHELKLQARLDLGGRVTAFAQAVALADRRLARRDGSVQTRQWWERGQAWLMAEGLAGQPLSVQVGRVALLERRAWWWDEDLDAVRMVYAPAGWRLETGLARELGRTSTARPGLDPQQRGITRWYGQGAWTWAPRQRAELFWLRANDRSGIAAPGTAVADGDEDPVDARLGWLGLRASGEWPLAGGHRATYRVDLARVQGRQTGTAFTRDAQGVQVAGSSLTRRVRGTAIDLGAQWLMPGWMRPALSLALAQGSGGPVTDTLDPNFRQTGLQENKSRVSGVKRMRFYGELLDPELSNLRIASAGLGLRLLDNSSIELLWHHYRQLHASPQLAGSRLSVAPTGLSREIGQAVDLFIALREWERVEWTLTLSRFMPGAAFAPATRDPATAVELGLNLQF